MKKAEAEKAIRSLCHTWADTLTPQQREHPSFGSFTMMHARQRLWALSGFPLNRRRQ